MEKAPSEIIDILANSEEWKMTHFEACPRPVRSGGYSRWSGHSSLGWQAVSCQSSDFSDNSYDVKWLNSKAIEWFFVRKIVPRLNEKPWFFWLLPGATAWSSRAVLVLASRKKVTTQLNFSVITSMARNYQLTKKYPFLLSLFIGLKSNQKRLLNFYKELAIASLRCACHRWRTFAACYGSIARLLSEAVTRHLRPSSADAGGVSRRAASPLNSQHSSV